MWGSGGMNSKLYRLVVYGGIIAAACLQSFPLQAAQSAKAKEVVKRVRPKRTIGRVTDLVKMEKVVTRVGGGEVTKRAPGLLQMVTPEKVKNMLYDGITDSVQIWKNFFTRNTMGVLSVALPLYLIGRQVDPILHRQFYKHENHLNVHQPPAWMKSFFYEEKFATPIFVGYAMSCLAREEENSWREAQLFGLGLFWAWTSKILVKQIKVDGSLRPSNEAFDKDDRVHGGSPSGHMTSATYLAAFSGLSRGPRFGIPFSLYAATVGSVSIASNKHYMSQVIAGAGLGFALGLATYLVFENYTFPKDIQAGLITDQKGNLGIRIAYDF